MFELAYKWDLNSFSSIKFSYILSGFGSNRRYNFDSREAVFMGYGG